MTSASVAVSTTWGFNPASANAASSRERPVKPNT
jgi:hypothetical protein